MIIFFLNLTGLQENKEYQIKNVKLDFETLANLANIIASQQKKIVKLRAKLSKFENSSNASNHHSYFSNKQLPQIIKLEEQEQSTPENK